MVEKLEFKPTKSWIKAHKYRPGGCNDKECYCIIDHFNKHDYGFCVGITLNNDDSDLDMISFCHIAFNIDDEQSDETESHRFLWHPTEAQWIATCIGLASINAWGMLPAYRKQLGDLSRQRTRKIKAREERGK